ncbi:hypothetical protein S7335_3350 [Synechococcus sp. PCC 7335]|nr:hypothetical protein S7335_3350 [Synechococcus sp. PCC 7335]
MPATGIAGTVTVCGAAVLVAGVATGPGGVEDSEKPLNSSGEAALIRNF